MCSTDMYGVMFWYLSSSGYALSFKAVCQDIKKTLVNMGM
jgi:hypothetical protein